MDPIGMLQENTSILKITFRNSTVIVTDEWINWTISLRLVAINSKYPHHSLFKSFIFLIREHSIQPQDLTKVKLIAIITWLKLSPNKIFKLLKKCLNYLKIFRYWACFCFCVASWTPQGSLRENLHRLYTEMWQGDDRFLILQLHKNALLRARGHLLRARDHWPPNQCLLFWFSRVSLRLIGSF